MRSGNGKVPALGPISGPALSEVSKALGERETERQRKKKLRETGVGREEQKKKQRKEEGAQREVRRKRKVKKTDSEKKKPGQLCTETSKEMRSKGKG